MNSGMKQLLVAALMCMMAAPLLAQTSPATTPSTATPGINKRQLRQQARIRQGVRSGELTPSEAKNLEKREAKIQADKKAAKADGKVTPQERKKLNRELNRTNRAIRRKKHNLRHR